MTLASMQRALRAVNSHLTDAGPRRGVPGWCQTNGGHRSRLSPPVNDSSSRRSTVGSRADWRDLAACRQHDPELFFPVGTSRVS